MHDKGIRFSCLLGTILAISSILGLEECGAASFSFLHHHHPLLRDKATELKSELLSRQPRVGSEDQTRNDLLCSENSGRKIWLVVGDGDLSYSAYLARSLPADTSLIATVLEDQASHLQIYKNSLQNSESIQSAHGQKVQFGVDATCLESKYPKESFHRIIFNFPHWRGKANNRYNRKLLDAFLASAVNVLDKKKGEIHMALCQGQGGMEAKSMQQWRRSWLAAEFAANHGLLLKHLTCFQAKYNRSSHRGVDRPFAVGDHPLNYVFGFPPSYQEKQSIDRNLQLACRHELRIVLCETSLATCRFSREQLVSRESTIFDLCQSVVPSGIGFEIPCRQVGVSTALSSLLLILLIVYRGDAVPLTRSLANELRFQLETAVEEQLGLQVYKPNRLVSKPFPYALLDQVVEEYES